MPVPGLFLQAEQSLGAALPSRADVALFVGLVARRTGRNGAPTPIPTPILDGFREAGWMTSSWSAPRTARPPQQIEALLDLPVPIERWEDFDALFAWNGRLVEDGGSARIPSHLGAAVRSFFAEGGRKCYVLRCGDPPPVLGGPDRAGRGRLLSWAASAPPDDAGQRVPILPGLAKRGNAPSPTEPTTWHGAAHLFGLDDVALLSLPDLPELAAPDPASLPPPVPPPRPPEAFAACAASIGPIGPPALRPAVTAPRLDEEGYRIWAEAIQFTLGLLRAPGGNAHRRDVQFIAALPLALHQKGSTPLDVLEMTDASGIQFRSGAAIGSALLQLAYPWVVTEGSATMPEGLEAPDGAMAGLIARSALLNGAFRSVAGQRFATVTATRPLLTRGDLLRALPKGEADWLGDRVSLIAPRGEDFIALSDATMSDDPAWRAGGVSRLMGIILRAGRFLGTDLVFEASGEALWARLRRTLEQFLTELWSLGALDGASPAEAFEVRCDRSTMTQADIDQGRVIARVAVTAAQPVERITVTLALGGAGGLIPRVEAA